MKKVTAGACIAAALLLPASPAGASDPAGTRRCPPGYSGFVVYVWDLETRLFCFKSGP